MIPELAGRGNCGIDDVSQQVSAGSRAVGIFVGHPGGFQDTGPDFPALLVKSSGNHFSVLPTLSARAGSSSAPGAESPHPIPLMFPPVPADIHTGASMIRLTRLSRVPMVLNSDLIEHIDVTPDTVITLTNGQILRVLESAEEVIRRIVDFRRQIFGPDGPPFGLAADAAASGDPESRD
jgi:flagellar protein FlbD